MLDRIYEPRAYGAEPVADCYWTGTVDAGPDWPRAEGAARCEFAVIGAGYTGMNAAMELAAAGADVIVLDAERPGWGASGRNGGFCCDGGSKLSDRQLRRRYGEADLRLWRQVQRDAIDHVASLLDRLGIDADRRSRGETLLAHRPRDAAGFAARAEEFQAAHGLKPQVLGREALAEHGLAGPCFHGALTTPLGFALNPMKYAAGLARALVGAGVRVYGRSPVTRVERTAGGWRLTAGRASISAARLIVATNGYSSENLPDWMAARYLPTQSSIMVTRPMSESERAAQGFTSEQMCADTRTLLHYFRLLPDGAMLLGMRGGIRADTAAQSATRRALRRSFETMFPQWAAVETAHYWSGMVCLSARMTPFVGTFDDAGTGFAAFAYHGNGVAMGSYCGRLVAERALGRKAARPTPAFLARPPRRFPLGRHRRALLHLAYGWYQLRDR